jgi:hypothetical protein
MRRGLILCLLSLVVWVAVSPNAAISAWEHLTTKAATLK